MSSKPKFLLTEANRLLIWYDTSILVFEEGSWIPWDGYCGELWDARSLTEEQAMIITGGIKPTVDR